MTENVSHLHAVQSIAADVDDSGILGVIADFLKSDELLTDWDKTDVTLERPAADETKVGKLNAYETSMFVVGTLLQQVLKETLIDLEADSTDTLAQIMRKDRVNMTTAADTYRKDLDKYLTVEEREYMNKIGLTIGYTLSSYEWSVRLRYGIWTGPLIVRDGFMAYVYNG